MSANRTLSRTSAKIATVVASSALATSAVIAGAAGAAGANAGARPAIVAGPAQVASAPALVEASSGPATAVLDGYARSYTPAQFTAAQAATPPRGAQQIHQGLIAKAAAAKHRKHHLKRHRRLTPRQIGRRMLAVFGWSWRQFKYLDWLWDRESSWNVHASNPFSGAYGIPQAVPAAKMASAGPDWRTDAATQIRWGMRYIKAVYGSPLRAWHHEIEVGWY